MSNQFWDANSVAGSGTFWTAVVENTPIHHRQLFEQEYMGSWSTATTGEQTVESFTTAPEFVTPELTKVILQDILEMVDGYRSPVYSKKEIKRLEDEQLNKKVHDIIKAKMKC